MKKISATVLALALVSSAALAADDQRLYGDESYLWGYCLFPGGTRLNPPVNTSNPNVGVLYEVISGAKSYDICCPQGQQATGNVDPKQPLCKVPGASRGCSVATNTEIGYCNGSPPFKICCPDGQVPTCNPDSNKQQCVQNQFGKILDGMACMPNGPTDELVAAEAADAAINL
jgi:hypothetical protein